MIDIRNRPKLKDDTLLPGEIWWRSRYFILERRGYQLRPRFHPDWTPSWRTSGKERNSSEDSIPNPHTKTIDATHIESGRVVIIKKITKNSSERDIALFTSSEEMQDPRNHCVPILETFEDELESWTEFLVMPLLRFWFNPPFAMVEEVLDFIRQTLEGVAFLHENNIAHRDCCSLNIMLDPQKMYPKGFHPSVENFTPDITRPAPFVSRTAAGGVRYYFTDFGISTHFKSDDERRQVTGRDCQDKSVPELSDDVYYDPFAVDIYTLGNLYKDEIIKDYKNFEFLLPLAESMTMKEPKSRPSASKALEQFEDIVERQPIHVIKWKAKQVKSNRIEQLYQDITSFGPTGMAYFKQLFSLPFRKAR